MWDAKDAIDLITICQHLKDRDQLEGVGGMAYIASLSDAVPSAANIEYYLEIVLDKFALRQVILVCGDLVTRAFSDPLQVSELVAQAYSAIQVVSETTVTETTVKSAAQLMPGVEAMIDKLQQDGGEISGLTTGLLDLDKMTWGLHPTQMIVIAARPSMGKTALGLNIADHVAVNLKLPVGVFSLEMSDESLMLRCLCARARVSMRKMRDGFLGQLDWQRLVKAVTELKKAPLYIDDSSGLSILQLRAKARRMQQMFGIKLLVIDYIQLMHANVRRNASRENEVSEISRGLKGLAKELDVPIIVLAQLNRKLEDRGPKAKPKMSDLRESGSIEQDADVVGLLYRTEGDAEQDETGFHSDVVGVSLLIAKSRSGPTGTINLTFLRSCTRFEGAAPASAAAEPEAQSSLPYAND